jgi:enamine deaminase RidA (YjgF/YER057c/UK114 family)
MTVKLINPDTMYKSPVFSQVATVSAGSTLVFVGGQDGITKDGKLVGQDIESQSEQAMKNVILALEAANATLNDVVKVTIYMVQGQDVRKGLAGAQKAAGNKLPATLVTGIMVAGLANPETLIEIEAIAAVGGKS